MRGMISWQPCSPLSSLSLLLSLQIFASSRGLAAAFCLFEPLLDCKAEAELLVASVITSSKHVSTNLLTADSNALF